MTRIYLTDKDYQVINRGNPEEIKRHFNDVRGELVELQETVHAAIQQSEPAKRVCLLRKEDKAHDS